MSGQRKRYSADFKAKVALEAIRGELTIAQLVSKHGVHQTLINGWKKHALKGWSASSRVGRKRPSGIARTSREAAREDRPTGGGTGFFAQGLRSLSVGRRREMIEPEHSASVDCAAVRIGFDKPVGLLYRLSDESPLNLALMRLIDEQFLETPVVWQPPDGAASSPAGPRGRPQAGAAADDGRWGWTAVYQRPKTTVAASGAQDLALSAARLGDRPAEPGLVCGHHLHPDAAGLPVSGGGDGLGSRKVLSWRLSNTMDVEFCIEALEEALTLHGRPEIFNTDQGSQFTSLRFTEVLKEPGVAGLAWMAAGAGWTTSSSSGCGGR